LQKERFDFAQYTCLVGANKMPYVWRFLYNPCRRLTKLSPFEPGKIRDSCDAFLWRTNPAFNGLGVGDSVIRVTQTHPGLFQPPTTGEGVERSREHCYRVWGTAEHLGVMVKHPADGEFLVWLYA